ncbi:hypothetical protein NDU88_000217 [Pleurodeles waltl]|uniref:Uncharacterized protein n=1 Tax=Pleurodeles waltl TaxID=8319 RepID=A0AAV7S6Y3_PLEWA|nr:hypothetical protein NDU88_000217 [Pleurodeles waltl]
MSKAHVKDVHYHGGCGRDPEHGGRLVIQLRRGRLKNSELARQPGPPALESECCAADRGRCGWASAADPRYAVGCAEPARPSGGLQPILPFKAAALRGKAGRSVSRRSGPREAAAAGGSSGRTAGTGELLGAGGPGETFPDEALQLIEIGGAGAALFSLGPPRER